MPKLLNADYWKKAYLLEFRKNDELTDAFTFSVPPESEDFVFPQRKSETKTFGGGVIAEYGNDFVQISLSGSTINQELKMIYKSRLGTDNLTGEQEIFYLRDLLRDYGKQNNLQGKQVYLFSLNGGGRNIKNNPKWWQISVGDLTISRNKDKPFCYNYKFTATGYPEVTPKKKRKDVFGSVVKSWYSKMQTLCGKMEEGLDLLETYGAGYISDLNELITTARTGVSVLINSADRYIDVVNGIITDTFGLVSNTAGIVSDATVDTLALGDKVVYSALRFYPTIASETWNNCLNVQASFKAIADWCASIPEDYFSTESAGQNIKTQFSEDTSDLDISDTYSTIAHESIKAANEAVAISSKTVNTMGFAVMPGTNWEDDKIVITYGYKNVIITDAETNWDQLAMDYYGDPSLGTLIATYNNLSSDTPLESGISILIPKLEFSESNASENEVYNSHDEKDNYGKDVLINEKDFGIVNGDLDLSKGIKNLEQALLNRYSTLIGARIRLEAYGIQASIGDALNATSSLIQASVHQTTIEDPRVDNVEDINFVGVGDELTVTVIYVDINGARKIFGGTI
ncbi:MAG: hypothetical protein J5710_14160 [Treponema sp.]|nr:hypothetical protein [Treponema sp.]